MKHVSEITSLRRALLASALLVATVFLGSCKLDRKEKQLPTDERKRPMKEEKAFTTPSEPDAKYYVVNEPKFSEWENTRTVTIKRVDKDGVHFAQRQFGCTERDANYLKEGSTYESAQPVPGTYYGLEERNPRSIPKRAKKGSITEVLLNHVCRDYTK